MNVAVSPINCRPPTPDEWIRVRAGGERVGTTGAVRAPDTGRLYIVSAELWSRLGDRIEWICPRACINEVGQVFIWPIPVPGPGGDQQSWLAAARLVAGLAEQKWIRLEVDREHEQYRIATEGGKHLPDPVWPAGDFLDLLCNAFRGHIVATADHPLIGMWGRV
jgi:hypothetical protein